MKELCLRDADEDELGGFEDMTRLTYLNEPGVLYNIRRRYALNDIYVSLCVLIDFVDCLIMSLFMTAGLSSDWPKIVDS